MNNKKLAWIFICTLIIAALFVGLSIVPSTGVMLTEKNAMAISRFSSLNSNTDYVKRTDVDSYVRPFLPTNRGIIDGLYYMRDDYPVRRNDEGSLLRTIPTEDEVTFCDQFVVFHFAQPGSYLGTYNISNIYYHIWQRAPTPDHPYFGELFRIGYSTLGRLSPHMNESFYINTSNHVSCVDDYRLVQAMQYTDPEIAFFEGDEIFNLTIAQYGCHPRVRTNPVQYSFVILNLEDNETLQVLDRDGDHLSNYDELFVYVTNPFDRDTDDDGATDFEEVKASDYGYQNSDPNDYGDTTNFRLELWVDAYGPYTGVVGEPIELACYVDGTHPPYTYHWDFGDGTMNTSTTSSTFHAYNETSEYTVCLTVIDSANPPNEASDTSTVIITDPEPLIANAQGPYNGSAGEPIQFYGSATNGVPPYQMWWWDFGDGNTSDDQNPVHTYIQAGEYLINFTVTDYVGNTANDSTIVIIMGAKPLEVDNYGPYIGILGEPIQFYGSATGGIQPYQAWQWDFDDDNTSDEQNPVHTYIQTGEYTITLTVTDYVDTVANDTTTTVIYATHPDVVYVNDEYYDGGDNDGYTWGYDAFNTIGDALLMVADQGTIIVRNGIYHQHVSIDKSVNLLGENNDNTIIDGNGSGTVVTISADNVVISGFTIQNSGSPYPPSYPPKSAIIISSQSNTITENIITNNNYGIYLHRPLGSPPVDNNCIYHNNFINNSQHASATGSNTWDDGYPSGGNYWDDYTGMDNDSDGIGDIPYDNLGSSNTDRYPLMNCFVLGDMNVDGLVNGLDIDPFVLALQDPDEYMNQYYINALIHGDINHDGTLDFNDILPFVQLLVGG